MTDFTVANYDVELGLGYRLVRLFFSQEQNGLIRASLFFRPEYTSESRGYEDPAEQRLVILQPLAAFADVMAILEAGPGMVQGGWLSQSNRQVVTFVLQTDSATKYGETPTRRPPEPLAFLSS